MKPGMGIRMAAELQQKMEDAANVEVFVWLCREGAGKRRQDGRG